VNPFSSLRKIIYVLSGILVFGTVGYMFLEDFTFLEALYQTVITVSTVGFGEVHSFDGIGKLFTIMLIVLSIGTFAFGFTYIAQLVLDGSLQSHFKFVRLKEKINKLDGHIIICGYGRNGKQAAAKIMAYDEPFVVIDSDIEHLEEGVRANPNLLYLQGDATQDEVLKAAGVERAKALISALHDDADNLFVVVSARQLNRNMRIVSRANQESTERKLLAAGANYTVSPNLVGGAHLAQNLMKPDIVEFLDLIDVGGLSAQNIEEILVSDLPDSSEANMLKDLDIRRRTGCNIIGFKDVHGEYVINPDPEHQLKSNSKLFVLGNEEQINKLRALIHD
jgi:voltage-gated potassium channel